MAAAAPEVLSNVEMWLPSEFLGDDFFMEEKRYRSMEEGGGALFRCFPYDSDSNLSSSPLESEDSDAEEGHVEPHHNNYNPLHYRETLSPHLTGTPNTTTATNSTKGAVSSSLACSPQSPLVTWSDHHPKGPTLASSPPDNAAAWDRLCAAAGRMSLADELVVEQQQKLGGGCGLHGAPRKVSSVPCPVPQKNPTPVGYYYFDGAVHHRHQHNGFQMNQARTPLQQQLKQKQLLKQHLSAAWSRQNPRCGTRGVVGLNGNSNSNANNPRGGCHPLGLSRSTWPPLQAQTQAPPGSGMRAVFLGGGAGAGARKQSSGTGVFLPRRVGSPTEPRKKPACSTVLVPAKVVQALNLNLEEMGGVVVGSGGLPNPPRLPSGFFLDHEVIMNGRSGATLPLKRVGPGRPTPPQLPSLVTSHHPHQEIHLPPEWTY